MQNQAEELRKRFASIEKKSRRLEEATKLTMKAVEALLAIHEPELLAELQQSQKAEPSKK